MEEVLRPGIFLVPPGTAVEPMLGGIGSQGWRAAGPVAAVGRPTSVFVWWMKNKRGATKPVTAGSRVNGGFIAGVVTGGRVTWRGALGVGIKFG